MEADDLLCSRNAREEKGSLVVLLLAERARSECARSTRAFEDRPAHPLKRKTSELRGSIDGYVLEGTGFPSLDAHTRGSISLPWNREGASMEELLDRLGENDGG
jgi:hypothetical protein